MVWVLASLLCLPITLWENVTFLHSRLAESMIPGFPDNLRPKFTRYHQLLTSHDWCELLYDCKWFECWLHFYGCQWLCEKMLFFFTQGSRNQFFLVPKSNSRAGIHKITSITHFPMTVLLYDCKWFESWLLFYACPSLCEKMLLFLHSRLAESIIPGSQIILAPEYTR